ncbi:hypothetical protein HYH02_005232 [Chlamydomonas schloesseri]|uniref:AMP-dependent synthetase/ligase domain-containing protein n=1 Tax=Chlamydomonas schloesseri TaxID=2026947 RepID=A0A835WM25_9CHLO|nr:hypothetical protein HYH02_005232 [Chlamydomonas schloesseri]|eukprot:KAG2449704.1 hypothetical protein HYH02_005232 [Chlamydomonas schloesseri]
MSKYHESVREALASSGVASPQQVGELEMLLRGLTGECAADAPKIWSHLARNVLLPSHDFASHLELADAVYGQWPAAALGRPPLWLPQPPDACRTNIATFLERIRDEPWWRDVTGGCGGVASGSCCRTPEALVRDWRLLQRVSWEAPEAFWPAVLRHLRIRFHTPPCRALLRHPSDPDQCRWLPGARLNIAAAALESELAPPGCPALLWAPDGEPCAITAFSRAQLRQRVAAVAASLRRCFKPGDALALYLPLTPDSVALYLAAVAAGCVVVSVADSFSAEELRTRLDIAKAVGVFTQDVVLRGGKALPLYDKVVRSGTAAACVVLPAAESAGAALSAAAPALRAGDVTWRAFLGAATAEAELVELQPHIADVYEVTNILFSSGTTGEPKAIPWTHLTPLRCALDGWAQLDVRPGAVVCWPTSLGWMMGPWLLYAALLNGGTVALYGGAPLGRDFLQFVSAARVEVLGLVPSIVRAWRHGGAFEPPKPPAAAAAEAAGAAPPLPLPPPLPDLSAIRVFGSTGEASAAEDYHWLMSRIRGYRPVIEYCGGTEIGGGYISSTLLHPCAPSTFSTPTLGTRLVLLTSAESAAAGEDALGRSGQAVCDGGPSWWNGGSARRFLSTSSSTCSSACPPSSGAAPAAAGMAASGGVLLTGEVALAMPMLGVSQRLLNKDHHKVYYQGMPLYGSTGLPLRRHGDEMAALPAPAAGATCSGGGPPAWCYAALGRCDDTMNLGGIKVSSVELERAVVEGVVGVAEAAAIGVAPPHGGPEELYLFLVLRSSGDSASAGSSSGSGSSSVDVAALHKACQEAVRGKLNPLFKVTRVAVAPLLPRNASNKVMRRVLRDQLLQAGRSKL